MEQFQPLEPSAPEISLKEYFYIFWSWGWLIALAGLLAGVAVFIVSINTTPIYETSTRLLVSDPPAMRSIEYTGIVSGQTTTRTYAQMLLDQPVLQGVIEQLQLVTTPEELEETITVEAVRDTQLLVITVQNTNPFLAADIANTMATVFTDRIRLLQAQHAAWAAHHTFAACQTHAVRYGLIPPDMEAHIDFNRAIVGADSALHAACRLGHHVAAGHCGPPVGA